MYDVYRPKSELLRIYISEFTILIKEEFKPINYVAFPHYVGAIVFLSNATINYSNFKVKVSKANDQSIVVLGKYLKPLHVFYQNNVDEIAINFTSTGINYFFDDNFDKIAKDPFQFLNNEIWNDFSIILFNQNNKERIDLLEKFLLSQLRKKDLKNIEYAIEILQNDVSIRVKDLAVKMNISERTITRLFQKYTGCSPAAYKKILRFRNSVEMNNEKMNLTELSLDNAYYDSPHFTNEFKQLTAINPKKFFNQLTKIGDKEFPFIFK